MNLKTISATKEKTLVFRFAICMIAFVCILLIAALGISLLVENETVLLKNIKWLSWLSIILASFVGNLIGLKGAEGKILPAIILNVSGMVLLLVVVGILFFDGLSMDGWGSALSVLIGAAVVWAVGHMTNKKPKYKNFRSR